MRYKLDLSPKLDVSAPSITGARWGRQRRSDSLPGSRVPGPATPSVVDEKFIYGLKRIFEDSILGEIANVISDAQKCNDDLQHRGHVVAIAPCVRWMRFRLMATVANVARILVG